MAIPIAGPPAKPRVRHPATISEIRACGLERCIRVLRILWSQTVPERIALNAGTRVALVGVSAAVLLFGAYTSVRISRAELFFHRNTIDSVRLAVQLDPSEARYQVWLAELSENEGRDAADALERAAHLNPLDSRIWIRRGLTAESNGNRKEAERWLLHAAAIDRLMEPRWTLMNFYFRGREEDQFWHWARETFAISYGDRAPLFDLCWRMREDAAFIQSKALPEKYPILFQFAGFLRAKGRLQDAAVLAERILPDATADHHAAYLSLVDALLKGGDAGTAVRLWNALCERQIIPARRLNPAVGDSLTNGGFDHDPVTGGFEWRLPSTRGVTALRMIHPDEMRVTFSGQQDDACDPISQTVPLQPARMYRLQFVYRTSGVPVGSGLRVRALDQVTPDLSSADWMQQTLTFTAGPRDSGDILIEYRRPPGFVRIEGTLELRSITLEFAE